MDKKILEEVVVKRKNQAIDKKKISDRIENELLNKKKRRDETHKYYSAQLLVKNYREKQKSYSAYKSKSNSIDKLVNQTYDSSKEHNPIILIRICGIWNRIPKQIQTILKKLNLNNLYNAVILFYNKDNLKIIKLIDNYITWGYIKKSKIEEILRKRGSVLDGSNEPNLLENAQIENALGNIGMFCIEDIVQELSFETANAPKILKFLGYFTLSYKPEGFEKVNVKFDKGGSTGFRGEKINDLLKEMI